MEIPRSSVSAYENENYSDHTTYDHDNIAKLKFRREKITFYAYYAQFDVVLQVKKVFL